MVAPLVMAIGGLIPAIGKILDNLFTSDEERAKAEQALEQIVQLPEMRQIDVNLKEAEHSSLFVAGWRPAIGWVCAGSLAWTYIFHGLGDWTILTFAPEGTPLLPNLPDGIIFELVLAMLGLSGWRTLDKIRGVDTRRV